MKNLKISAKLTVAFSAVIAIYILSIAALLLSYMLSNNRLNNMNEVAVKPHIVIGQLRDAVLKERVAVNQLVLLTPGAAQYTQTAKAREDAHQHAIETAALYREVSLDDEGAKIAQEIQSYYENEYSAFITQLLLLAKGEDNAAATEWIQACADVESAMDQKLELAAGMVDERVAYFTNDARFGLIRLIIISAVVLVFIFVFIALIIRYMQRNISRRIETLSDTAGLMAAGNLDVELARDSRDEIGRLTETFAAMAKGVREQAKALTAIAEGDLTVSIATRSEQDMMNMTINKMVRGLNQMFSQIRESTNQVSNGSRQIASGAQMLAQGATEQATAVEQISNSVAGVTQATKNNCDMAGEAAQLMNAVNTNAASGSEQMDKMSQAVQDISAASQSIGKVIKTIDDIAFQTNILALNAAVEAARAGHHGKGFAVVADEVRNLASKSAEAAKETGALIENSIQKAELGAQIADDAVKSFEQIATGIKKSTNLLSDIARLSEQQSESIHQISQSVGQVAQVVQQNSATAEQSAASSEELSAQSEVLKELISRFRVSDGDCKGDGGTEAAECIGE